MKSLTATIGMAMWLSCMLAGCAALATGNLGKREFEANCASCHGVSGKGDGPQALALPIRPADLTRLAKKNGGIFPAEHVSQIIDGRVDVTAHGPREMPVWGVQFQVVAPNLPQDISEQPFGAREANVHAKIKALVDYLSSLQDLN